jgi:uncharacterized protein (TIGR03435 family)
MRRFAGVVAIVSLAAVSVPGQTSNPSFDVASVKPNGSGDAAMRISAPAGTGRFEATNVTPRQLILNAYGLRDFQLVDVPSWAADERFDIAGRAATSATRDQISAMVRTLLADRFRLQTRRETREMAVYALVTATPDRRLGPALTVTTTDCPAAGGGAPRPAAPARSPGNAAGAGRGAPDVQMTCGTRQSPTSLNAGNMTMARLALTLSGLVGRVVNDETGLAGTYDLRLTFTPEPRPGPGGPPIPVDPDAPSIFTALPEQLGLRLNSTRGPVDVVVIDRIERPTAD